MPIKEIEKWDIYIRSKSTLKDINLKEIWEYKDLILLFVKRDWQTVYKQTILGPVWAIIQPLFMTIIFSMVFWKIGRISTEGTSPLLFYFSALLPWNYFNSSFSRISNTLSDNAHLFGKVYFPRLTIPISNIISALIPFSINLILFIIILFFNSYDSKASLFDILLLPYLLFIASLFSMGSGLIITSLTTKYRDLSFLVNFGLQLFMYATPIIYPLSAVPDKFKIFIILNPMTGVIEGFRKGLLGIGANDYSVIIYSSVFIFFTFVIGVSLFNKSEKTFIDTI